MKKEEMKQWVKEYKKDIAEIAAITVGAVAFGCFCFKKGEIHAMPWDAKTRKAFKGALCAADKGAHGYQTLVAEGAEGFAVTDFGDVGKILMNDVPDDTVYRSMVLIADKPFNL